MRPLRSAIVGVGGRQGSASCFTSFCFWSTIYYYYLKLYTSSSSFAQNCYRIGRYWNDTFRATALLAFLLDAVPPTACLMVSLSARPSLCQFTYEVRRLARQVNPSPLRVLTALHVAPAHPPQTRIIDDVLSEALLHKTLTPGCTAYMDLDSEGQPFVVDKEQKVRGKGNVRTEEGGEGQPAKGGRHIITHATTHTEQRHLLTFYGFDKRVLI